MSKIKNLMSRTEEYLSRFTVFLVVFLVLSVVMGFSIWADATTPQAVTVGADTITKNSAVLYGYSYGMGNGSITSESFIYGLSSNQLSLSVGDTGSNFPEGPFSFNIEPVIACGKSYYYQAVVGNSYGFGYGEVMSFSTLDCDAPSLSDRPATSITTNSATLNANVDSLNGNQVSSTRFLWDEWLPEAGGQYAFNQVADNVVGGENPTSYSLNLTGLSCGTTYYYLSYTEVFNNGHLGYGYGYSYNHDGGDGYGYGSNFTTLACVAGPAVTTLPASSVDQNSAVFSGLYQEPYESMGYGYGTGFLYSTDSHFMSGVGSSSGNPSQVSYGDTFTANSPSLSCGTKYYYKAYSIGTSNGAVGYGGVMDFSTLACTSSPVVVTSAADSVSYNIARLNAVVSKLGGGTGGSFGFLYGLTSDYGLSVSSGSAPSTGPHYVDVSSLSCGTTYHFKAYVTNSSGTGYGDDANFKTTSCSKPIISSLGSVTGDSTVRLSANITNLSGGVLTRRGFLYSADLSFGSDTFDASGSTGQFVKTLLSSNLTCGTVYNFKPYATVNTSYGDGTSYGTAMTFNSPSCPVVDSTPSPVSLPPQASSPSAQTSSSMPSQGFITSGSNVPPTVAASPLFFSDIYKKFQQIQTNLNQISLIKAQAPATNSSASQAVTTSGVSDLSMSLQNIGEIIKSIAEQIASSTAAENANSSSISTSSSGGAVPALSSPTSESSSSVTPAVPAPAAAKISSFGNFEIKDQNPEILRIQRFLNSEGFFVALQGPGSLGMETEKFGKGTYSALKKFQESAGITPADGSFNQATKDYLSARGY